MAKKIEHGNAKSERGLQLFKSIFIIAIIGIIIGFSVKPLLNNLKFGLDLQGGFEILYQVESLDGTEVTTDMVSNTYKTISKRINALGVSEPEIIVEGTDRIRVQLAGVTDATSARKTLSSVANLSFRDSSDNLLMTSDVLKAGGAKVGEDDNGRPAVSLTINDNDTFYNVTKAISQTDDKLIVIWLDYEMGKSYSKEKGTCGGSNLNGCLSAATVSQAFSGDVIIQGSFTLDEVKELVSLINSGSLPTKLTEISSKTTSAQFGENSLELTAKAGLIGVGLIMLVMIVVYHFAGLIASIGICIYTFLTFLTFWLFGGVLTLPGIAALVIGIGMAVDSCIITFARIKDELAENVKLSNACIKGNKSSFMAIFDSNITTLLVAVILFIFGESTVKGFATMLIISTIVTMIIMVFLTRTLIGLFVKTELFNNKLNLFIGFKKSKKDKKVINFVKVRKIVYVYLALLIAVGAFTLYKNQLTLGIDFKGGSSISITSDEDIDVKSLKEDLKDLGYTIYNTEEIDSKNVIIKVEESFEEEEVLTVEALVNENYNAKTDIGVVSNMVKRDLVKNAIYSIIIAAIGIVIYVSFRFKFTYAISAIVALLHDVFAIVVLFSICKIEVSSIFIAAILSIIGYSINDTIVSFDRVRENIKAKDRVKNEEELAEIVNRSLSQTLVRSIITTITTLCPVVTLILFGSHEIINFNIALLIGLVMGVLSSIFVACQLWFTLEKNFIGRPPKKKWYEEDEPKTKKVVKKDKKIEDKKVKKIKK